jgi:hypothetical protein
MVSKIKNLFKESMGITVSVRKQKLATNSDQMNKMLFVEVVKILKQLAMDTDYMREEIGVDLSGIEEQYYVAINHLLRMNFTGPQVELISYYVYEMPHDDEFEGKMEVAEKNKVSTYTFKTPEDLWDILKLVK